MKLVLLSDIHANVTALRAVLKDIQNIGPFDYYAILGDLVNYGPRPNNVIEIIEQLYQKTIVNIWGNHEYSIFGGSLDRFTTDRGRTILKYTNSILTDESKKYIDTKMNHQGYEKCTIEGKHILFIHGKFTLFRKNSSFKKL